MRILYVVTRLSTGGAEKALYRLLSSGLGEHGQPAVVSLLDEGTYGPRLRDTGIPVYALNMRRGLPGPIALKRLYDVAKETRPDLIQGWMYHGNLAASVAGHFSRGKPVTVWGVRQSLYSLSDEKRLSRQVIKAGRWVSGSVDSIVYNSTVSRRQHEAFGFESRCGRVIPNGFAIHQDDSEPGGTIERRRTLGIPENAVVLGHVARFHPMKDHAGFIRAAVRLAEADERIHVILAGSDVVPENEELTCLVPEKLRSRFHWLGERDDVPCLLRSMDVFCLSSWSEAFPNVLGEAMACGVPCVTTDVGDSADIVADTGVIVPPSDSEALRQGLVGMMQKTPEERRSLGRKARERIEGRYGLDSVVAQYTDLYSALMDRHSE